VKGRLSFGAPEELELSHRRQRIADENQDDIDRRPFVFTVPAETGKFDV
jgi:hypothetical protein